MDLPRQRWPVLACRSLYERGAVLLCVRRCKRGPMLRLRPRERFSHKVRAVLTWLVRSYVWRSCECDKKGEAFIMEKTKSAGVVAAVAFLVWCNGACSSASQASGAQCQTLCESASACPGATVAASQCGTICAARQKLADDARCDAQYGGFLGCVAAQQSVCSAESMCMIQGGMVTACRGPCESQSTSVSTCLGPFCSQSAHGAECQAAQ
jgi:hypothetical protein